MKVQAMHTPVRVAVPFIMQRLRLPAGARPVYGWLHARWAAARAVQRCMFTELTPLVCRTPLLPALYRALGASIGPGVLLDGSVDMQDPQLLTIGDGSKLGFGVRAAGATIAPLSIPDLGDTKVLIFSEASKMYCHQECLFGQAAESNWGWGLGAGKDAHVIAASGPHAVAPKNSYF